MPVTIKRGFPFEFHKKLWDWLNSPRDPNFDDFGPTPAEFAFQLHTRIKNEYTWGVWLDGELVGYFAFVPQSPMAGQFHGLVIAPRHRGKGVGRAAVQLAMDELKGDGFKRFVVWTFADNERIYRMFRALDFMSVGCLPKWTVRNGRPLDIRVLYWDGKEDVCRSADS